MQNATDANQKKHCKTSHYNKSAPKLQGALLAEQLTRDV